MKKINQKYLKIVVNNSKYPKKIIVKHFKMPNNEIQQFITNNESHSVVVFALTKQQDVYLVKQFRPGLETYDLELPDGSINKGEEPIIAAKRELLEETGLVAGSIQHLGSIPYGPYSSGIKHMYMALNCTPTGKTNLDYNEFLEVKKYSLTEIKQMIKTASIRGFDVIYLGLDHLSELAKF